MQATNTLIVDQYFYYTLHRAQHNWIINISWLIVRIICLLLSVPINFILLERGNQQISLLTKFISIVLIFTLLQVGLQIYGFCLGIKNQAKIQQIANITHHTQNLKPSQEQLIIENIKNDQIYFIDPKTGIKISRCYYDFEAGQKIDQISSNTRKQRQKSGQSKLKRLFQESVNYFKFLNAFIQFLSLAIIISGLILRLYSPLNDVQRGLLYIILATQVMMKQKLYTIVLLICLVPFLIIFMCLLSCWITKPKVKLPPKQLSTQKIIEKCNECVICYQSISVGEEVMVLPCFDMHIFHNRCLLRWTKVKPSCPTCRSNLAK